MRSKHALKLMPEKRPEWPQRFCEEFARLPEKRVGALCFHELERTGYKRITEVSSHVARKDMHKVNPMKHIQLLFSNLKTWLRGRSHGVTHRYLQNDLDESIYRLNRRHDPPRIFGWIVRRLTSRHHVSLAMMRSPEIGA